MEDRNREISFSGCGLLAFYHAGVGQCVQERAPRLLSQIRAYYGASAGAITAVMAACRIDAKRGFAFLKTLHEAGRHWALGRFGVFHPRFNLERRLREFLNDILPPNAHRLCSGKVYISLTVLPEMRNWLVTDFNTRAELINALVASSYIPVWGGFSLPVFRGKRCADGGLTVNLPCSDNPHLITVSPFSGSCDICPKDSGSVHQIIIKGTPAQICWSNIRKGVGALLPMSWEEVESLYHQGYQDTLSYLEREGLIQSAPPDPEAGTKQDSSSCSPPDDSTSDYFSMTHSRQSSTLPGLDELLEEEEEEEEERAVTLTTSPLRGHLAAMLRSLQSQQWLRSVPHSWQGMTNLLHLSKEEQLSLLRRLWQTIRELRTKMEQSLSSSSGGEGLNCERMLSNALTLPS